MLNKLQFLQSLRTEFDILRHLHAKIPSDQLDRSLGQGMRSNLELLRYLTYCASLPAICCIEGAWSRAGEMIKESGAAEMKAEDFPAAMDRQWQAVEEVMAGVSDEDLESRKAPLPWGIESSLGQALVDTSLKFMTAYRMQLFLQLKSGGVAPLDTFNCWVGHDRPGAN